MERFWRRPLWAQAAQWYAISVLYYWCSLHKNPVRSASYRPPSRECDPRARPSSNQCMGIENLRRRMASHPLRAPCPPSTNPFELNEHDPNDRLCSLPPLSPLSLFGACVRHRVAATLHSCIPIVLHATSKSIKLRSSGRWCKTRVDWNFSLPPGWLDVSPAWASLWKCAKCCKGTTSLTFVPFLKSSIKRIVRPHSI